MARKRRQELLASPEPSQPLHHHARYIGQPFLHVPRAEGDPIVLPVGAPQHGRRGGVGFLSDLHPKGSAFRVNAQEPLAPSLEERPIQSPLPADRVPTNWACDLADQGAAGPAKAAR